MSNKLKRKSKNKTVVQDLTRIYKEYNISQDKIIIDNKIFQNREILKKDLSWRGNNTENKILIQFSDELINSPDFLLKIVEGVNMQLQEVLGDDNYVYSQEDIKRICEVQTNYYAKIAENTLSFSELFTNFYNLTEVYTNTMKELVGAFIKGARVERVITGTNNLFRSVNEVYKYLSSIYTGNLETNVRTVINTIGDFCIDLPNMLVGFSKPSKLEELDSDYNLQVYIKNFTTYQDNINYNPILLEAYNYKQGCVDYTNIEEVKANYYPAWSKMSVSSRDIGLKELAIGVMLASCIGYHLELLSLENIKKEEETNKKELVQNKSVISSTLGSILDAKLTMVNDKQKILVLTCKNFGLYEDSISNSKNYYKDSWICKPHYRRLRNGELHWFPTKIKHRNKKLLKNVEE